MIKKFKLKHIDMLSEENIDYAKLMFDLDGYKNPRFMRTKLFVRSFNRTANLIKLVAAVDPKSIELNPGCQIKLPRHIDLITFAAMMEIHTLMNNGRERSIGDLMCEIVAMACFSANNKSDFDTSTKAYKNFKNIIWNKNAFDMIGLYNWIDKQIIDSKAKWDRLFFSVHIDDKDYEQAGGSRMSKFNVITTVKNICQDFNVSEEAAWQMSYVKTQTNSFAKATQANIQHNMSEIKEGRMKAQRKKAKP